ncbi:hypothetical protein JYU29_04960 [Tianweitania sp. BSSL-BM11]|uniref:Uncharacterized protein n=1 Tax=Tianweitania aestuarii TaxID=2814886 RepID=A0ABS5RSU7_9HYPH|nr:hypothetical protein [Tianweitania aestuarii]MBS9720037.1 hypothetical protein [Tianweitania aestuarii]
MVQVLLGAAGSLFGGGAAAGTAAAAGTVAGGTAATGLSLASILQGTATVLGVVSAVGAGNAEAQKLELEAADADREQPLETLQGIERRTSIKRAMADAIGAQDTAYAASGVDLSFGTAANARKDAYREADLSLTTATGTEMTRTSRLAERAAGYRSAAKKSRVMGWISGLGAGASQLASIKGRGSTNA